jgi:putative transposase
MTSCSTREFMAMCAMAQHFGRPGTPTDQAWIESLFSHIKADWPHLDRIRDPSVLRAELATIRHEYNTVRLHAGIGYVTPSDEHDGRGDKIRAARKRGPYDRPVGRGSHTIESNKPKPTAGAPPMWTDWLRDLWL